MVRTSRELYSGAEYTMESNGNTALSTTRTVTGPISAPASGPSHQIAYSGDVTNDVVQLDKQFSEVKNSFYELLAKSNGPVVSVLGILSILQRLNGVARCETGTVCSYDSIEELLHQLHTPVHIAQVIRHLFDDCRKFLFALAGAKTDLVAAATVPPVELWLEELEFVLIWVEKRCGLLSATKSYRLGEEGFFNVRVLVDTEKNGEVGVTVCSSLNLDSRGEQNLYLQLKVLAGGMPLLAHDQFPGWKEESTGHFFIELPLTTKGSRSVGRVVVDAVDLFVPYQALQWNEKQIIKGKSAEVMFLLSVLDRKGTVQFSERLPQVIRVSRPKELKAEDSFISAVQNGNHLWEKCHLKGNAIESLSAIISNDELIVNSSICLFSSATKDFQLDMRVLDQNGGTLHEEFYSLRPITNFARFKDVGTRVSLKEFNLHPEAQLIPYYVELVVTEENGKILCGSVVPLGKL